MLLLSNASMIFMISHKLTDNFAVSLIPVWPGKWHCQWLTNNHTCNSVCSISDTCANSSHYALLQRAWVRDLYSLPLDSTSHIKWLQYRKIIWITQQALTQRLWTVYSSLDCMALPATFQSS